MKYYIYISDAKVNMLLPQIPHDQKKKIASEFKIDLKILSASRKVETEIDDNRIARLEAVCNFIREFGNVGSVDESDDYIEDTLAMNWLIHEEPFYVYFSGTTDKTILGLGGSYKHLIGMPTTVIDKGTPSDWLTSVAPGLIRALRSLADADQNMPLESARLDLFTDLRNVLVHVSQIMNNNPRFPKQRLEFVAKRLSQFHLPDGERLNSGESSIILATPLYVAMAE